MPETKPTIEKLQGCIPDLEEFETALDDSTLTPEQIEAFIQDVSKFIEKLVELKVIDKTFTQNPNSSKRYYSYFYIEVFTDREVYTILRGLLNIFFKMKSDKDLGAYRPFVYGIYDLLKENSTYDINFEDYIKTEEG